MEEDSGIFARILGDLNMNEFNVDDSLEFVNNIGMLKNIHINTILEELQEKKLLSLGGMMTGVKIM